MNKQDLDESLFSFVVKSLHFSEHRWSDSNIFFKLKVSRQPLRIIYVPLKQGFNGNYLEGLFSLILIFFISMIFIFNK